MSNYVFSTVADLKRPRNIFDLSFRNTFTGSVGDLIPCYVQEVFAGDTFPVKANCVVRNNSPFLKPIMDLLYQDTYFFYVPYRIIQDNYPKIFGASDTQWAQTRSYKVAHFTRDEQCESKTVADYLGYPLGTIPSGTSCLPFRAFALIYNNYFRNENLIDETYIRKGDEAQSPFEFLNNNDWSPANYMGKLPKVAKYHDYFTSALPSPSKSANPVTISLSGDAPLDTSSNVYTFTNDTAPSFYFGGMSSSSMTPAALIGMSYGSNDLRPTTLNGSDILDTDKKRYRQLGIAPNNSTDPLISTVRNQSVTGTNLVAKTSGLGVISVDDLNFAIKLQSYYQALARAGSRYIEYLNYFFGVETMDSRLQRAEFLGGGRQPLNIQQVANTNGVNGQLGDLGAYSWTNTNNSFTKSFTEHGIVIGVTCLRYKHTYQQGIERYLRRITKEEIYNPLFAHIGEQPIYKYELFSEAPVDEVFGFQEAFADMRYRPNRVAGEMRSKVPNSLDIYTFADEYENAPVLGEEFNNETPQFVDRTISVPSTSQDQFIFDFYFEQHPARVLPKYSIPDFSTGFNLK